MMTMTMVWLHEYEDDDDDQVFSSNTLITSMREFNF